MKAKPISCGLCGPCKLCGRDVGKAGVNHKANCIERMYIRGCEQPAVAIVQDRSFRLPLCKKHLLDSTHALRPLT